VDRRRIEADQVAHRVRELRIGEHAHARRHARLGDALLPILAACDQGDDEQRADPRHY